MKYLKSEVALLILITAVATFFRFYNLNWDQKSYFHPDERNIANAVTKIHFFNQLDPQFFAYGGLTIYLDRATGDLINFLTHETIWTADWGNIDIIGRTWSAFFSALAIFPLFYLTKRLFDKRTALVGIILYTFTVTSIQSAHFGTTESILAFFSILVAFWSIKVLDKPTKKNFLILGALCGLAAAAKVSAASLLIFPAIVFLGLFHKGHQPFRLTISAVLFTLATLFAFTIFSPYTFLSWDKFMESMKYESGVATGSLPVVYTLQFKGTVPYLFQMKNLLFQVGPAVLFSFIGVIVLLVRLWQRKELKIILLLAFPLIYFAYVGSWYTKFIRYMVPIVPFLVIFAGFALNESIKQFKKWGTVITSLTILVTAAWAIAFFSIYTRPQTKILATEWIYQNIPHGNLILQEQWDDGLPIPWNGSDPNLYRIYQLAIYDQDNSIKADYYARWLSQGDYLEISSRRLYGTLAHLQDQYPLTSYYYYLLFSGKLGYRKVAEFTSYPQISLPNLGASSTYPQLGPLIINDDGSEETFQVFDHPKVMIFKNVGHFTPTQIHNILTRSTLAKAAEGKITYTMIGYAGN